MRLPAGVNAVIAADSVRRVAGRFHMTDNEFPDPQTGFVVTHFLVVSDQDRSRDFYRSVFGATVVLERDPVIMKIANSWLILNVGGGPTDDKPTVTLAPPAAPDRASAFLNIRVADIGAAYAEWSANKAASCSEYRPMKRVYASGLTSKDTAPTVSDTASIEYESPSSHAFLPSSGLGLAARPGLLPDVEPLRGQPDSGPYRQLRLSLSP